MFIFKIFGLFGFMTGPILLAIIGAMSAVKILSVFKGLVGFGGSGTAHDVASGGVFVSTASVITAATGWNKVKSKLRGISSLWG